MFAVRQDVSTTHGHWFKFS